MYTCFYCGKKSEEGKVSVNNPNEFVCQYCWENHPRCFSCQNLLPSGGKYYQKPDGKKICVSCNLVEEKAAETKKGEGKLWLGLIIGGIVIAIIAYFYHKEREKPTKRVRKKD